MVISKKDCDLRAAYLSLEKKAPGWQEPDLDGMMVKEKTEDAVQSGKRGKAKQVIIALALVAVGIAVILGIVGSNMFGASKKVGKDILPGDISEFYYTKASSTNPPTYLRYHFYTEGSKWVFRFETREGNHFPLTEEDITQSASRALTESEQQDFLALLSGGTVSKMKESTESGDAGPWLYLYHKNDRSKYRQFAFESTARLAEFETFCKALRQAGEK